MKNNRREALKLEHQVQHNKRVKLQKLQKFQSHVEV